MTTKAVNFARTGYIASKPALLALAKRYAEGIDQTEGVRGTYLRILVAHSKRELETQGVKRATTDIALGAVQAAHDQLYPIVLQAITTEDITPDEEADAEETRRRTRERNRRSTFARTSKTTLTRAIQAGERLAALDPATVTKEMLQARYAQVRAGPGSTVERITRVETTLETLIKELAQEDAEAAAVRVADIQKRLRAAVKHPEPAQPEATASQAPRQLIRGRKKVGELTLTAH